MRGGFRTLHPDTGTGGTVHQDGRHNVKAIEAQQSVVTDEQLAAAEAIITDQRKAAQVAHYQALAAAAQAIVDEATVTVPVRVLQVLAFPWEVENHVLASTTAEAASILDNAATL